MKISNEVAKHFREVYFGGNWTASNLKDQLADVTWQQATQQVNELHTIAELVYHIHYYVVGVLQFLEGGDLEIKDELSFDCPRVHDEDGWNELLERVWSEAEKFATRIEAIPDEKFGADFLKHGIYYRNLQGISEHAHYHLGQIAMLKKLTCVDAN